MQKSDWTEQEMAAAKLWFAPCTICGGETAGIRCLKVTRPGHDAEALYVPTCHPCFSAPAETVWEAVQMEMTKDGLTAQ